MISLVYWVQCDCCVNIIRWNTGKPISNRTPNCWQPRVSRLIRNVRRICLLTFFPQFIRPFTSYESLLTQFMYFIYSHFTWFQGLNTSVRSFFLLWSLSWIQWVKTVVIEVLSTQNRGGFKVACKISGSVWIGRQNVWTYHIPWRIHVNGRLTLTFGVSVDGKCYHFFGIHTDPSWLFWLRTIHSPAILG